MSITVPELKKQLEHDIEQLNHLNQLLSEEYQILLSRNLPDLQRITQSKEKLLSSLEHENIAIKLKSKSNFDKYFKFTEDTSLKNMNEQLLDILQKCHQQNQINGAITHMNRQHVQGILKILKGNHLDQATYTDR